MWNVSRTYQNIKNFEKYIEKSTFLFQISNQSQKYKERSDHEVWGFIFEFHQLSDGPIFAKTIKMQNNAKMPIK